jgi:hypothetical protein
MLSLRDPAGQAQLAVTLTQSQSELFVLGFEILRYLSTRISVDAEQDEYFAAFLTPMFEYFNNMEQPWSKTFFEKLIFTIIVNNEIRREVQFEDEPKDWVQLFKKMIAGVELTTTETQTFKRVSVISMMSMAPHKEEALTTDFNMLDQVLDFFNRYLVRGIVPEKDKVSSETLSPQATNFEIYELLYSKKDLIDVMSDVLLFLQPELNIRQYDDYRFIEAIFQLINYSAHVRAMDSQLQMDLEKNMRICIEIYLSKIRELDHLISILDYLMSSVQEEILS